MFRSLLEVSGQKSEVSGQRSEVSGQWSVVRSQIFKDKS